MTDATNRTRPGKRLALLFDGTWNKPENNTNVWRLSLMLAEKGEDGVPQERYYDPGVGTYWHDRVWSKNSSSLIFLVSGRR